MRKFMDNYETRKAFIYQCFFNLQNFALKSSQKIFKFLFSCLGLVGKPLDKKPINETNFKIYYVIYWDTNDNNTHIAQNHKK